MANNTPLERMKNRRKTMRIPPALYDPSNMHHVVLWNTGVLADMLIDLGELIEGREQNIDEAIQLVNEQVKDRIRPRADVTSWRYR